MFPLHAYNVHLIGGGDGLLGDTYLVMHYSLLQVDGHSNPDSISSARTPQEVKRIRRRIDCEPTITGKKTLRTLHGIKETTNPILRLPLNIWQ